MESSRRLSMGPIPIFKEGILLTLSRWWALQMAVVNEWGGRNSALLAEQLGEDILSWFTQSKEPLYIDDLEQILEKGLMSLNTMEEDGSIEEVAEKLMILHKDCLEGNFVSIQKLREASAMEAGHSNIKWSMMTTKIVVTLTSQWTWRLMPWNTSLIGLQGRYQWMSQNQLRWSIRMVGSWGVQGKTRAEKNSAPRFLPYGRSSSVYRTSNGHELQNFWVLVNSIV